MLKQKAENGEYLRLKELSQLMGEKSDCSVIAIAAALEITYQKAHDLLRRSGRKNRKGANTFEIQNALLKSGAVSKYRVANRCVDDYKYSNVLTFGNSVRALDKTKKYVLLSRDHAVALKHGEIIDWAAGRKMQVNEVFEVEDTESLKQLREKK